ncbi:MAG: ATP-binding protein [Acidobacteria bacterium]|nr:ATP-binding protein [Acidobacteriota bacterium]
MMAVTFNDGEGSVSQGPTRGLAPNIIEVSIDSKFEFLDLVQNITHDITEGMGFDEDSSYWIGLSVRESVINAIRHGNQLDERKKVELCFEVKPDRVTIYVNDQGEGFEAEALPDALDPANLLKPSGRGIFCIKSFMDEVDFHRLPGGGMQLRMVKIKSKPTTQ